jgi:RNA polymerase sigma-70 factor (ECF subfamily)
VPAASEQDLALVDRIRASDEAAFMTLVEQLQSPMLRVAAMYVSSRSVAEEVVQETWLGVLRGLDRFEGRSSLRTWIFRILTNTAKTRGQREGRSVPFSALAGDDLHAPAVATDRFDSGPSDPRGYWSTLPDDWGAIPEDRLLGRETLEVIGLAIEALPPMQAEVIRLRDVLGWTSDEVRNALDLTETNQRVLLHRARARVRGALERYLSSEAT